MVKPLGDVCVYKIRVSIYNLSIKISSSVLKFRVLSKRVVSVSFGCEGCVEGATIVRIERNVVSQSKRKIGL